MIPLPAFLHDQAARSAPSTQTSLIPSRIRCWLPPLLLQLLLLLLLLPLLLLLLPLLLLPLLLLPLLLLLLLLLQEAFSVLETCRWPVIAAVHGGCCVITPSYSFR
jgi:hypothetical protein